MDFIFLVIVFFIAFTSEQNQDYNNQQLSIQTTSNCSYICNDASFITGT